MKPEHLILLQLFGVLVAAYAVAAIVGQLLPRTGAVIAPLALLVVAVLWGLLAVEEPDGPGGALGVAMAGGLSLILLSAGIGLISGSQSNIEIGIGLLLGFMVAAIVHWWFFTYASPIVGACVLVSCSLGGYLLGMRRRQSLARVSS